MFSPKVEKAIKKYFPEKQKVNLDKKALAELLKEEEEKAIGYLKSDPH